MSDADTQFQSLFHDPLSSCHGLTRAAKESTASDFCRLEILSRSASLFSVSFEENGAFQMSHPTQCSCAAAWLQAPSGPYYFIENDASSLGQPLPQEWASFRTCSSFLSFRLCSSDDSTQRVWGTLTLASRKAHHFRQHERGIRHTLRLMDAFMRKTQTAFLTDVCQTIYDMKRSDSWNRSMGVLSDFYHRHAPVLSVSVAVRRAPANCASMFVEQESPVEASQQRSMEHVPLRTDEGTLFADIETSRGRHPVGVKVPFAARDASGQSLQRDVMTALSKHRWSPSYFLVLPLRKPAVRSVSEFSLVPAGDDGDGFVGVVYLRARTVRAVNEVRVQIHSLSPIFAALLQQKLPLIRESLDRLLIQDLPSPMNLEHQTTESTEMTEKNKEIIRAMNQHKAGDWEQQSRPLKLLKIEAVVSDESTNGVILKGTYNDRIVGIKVLSPGNARTPRACSDAQRRLEFAIVRCVDHSNVIKSHAHCIGISGQHIVQSLPTCRCHNGQNACQRCQVLALLQRRLIFGQAVVERPWDVMVMDFCDHGSLYKLIHMSELISGHGAVV